MKLTITIFCVLLTSITSAQENQRLEKYINYVSNPLNGLRVSVTQEELIYTLQIEPPEYLAFKDNQDNNELLDSVIKYRQNENILYFNLRIESKTSEQLLKKDLGDVNEYFQRLNYLSFNFKNNITAIINSKYYPCMFYHLERTYQSVPYLSFNFGFHYTEQLPSDITLTINDEVWNTGMVILTIKSSDLIRAQKFASLK